MKGIWFLATFIGCRNTPVDKQLDLWHNDVVCGHRWGKKTQHNDQTYGLGLTKHYRWGHQAQMVYLLAGSKGCRSNTGCLNTMGASRYRGEKTNKKIVYTNDRMKSISSSILLFFSLHCQAGLGVDPYVLPLLTSSWGHALCLLESSVWNDSCKNEAPWTSTTDVESAQLTWPLESQDIYGNKPDLKSTWISLYPFKQPYLNLKHVSALLQLAQTVL